MDALITIIFGLFFLALFAVWIYALIDSLKTSDSVWAAAGQNKILWVVLIVLLGALGGILYMVIPRPKLKAAGG